MYQYYGFGLSILSDREFPELLPASFSNPDVTILTGPVSLPGTGQQVRFGSYAVELHDHEIYFEAEEMATYVAKNGDTIVVHPHSSEADERTLRIFVLGTLLAAIVFQRNRLPLHASAILTDDGLALITGDSGVGKSSTLGGLIKKGRKVFSDDVVVLGPEKQVWASYPMIKLWSDTQEKLNEPAFAGKTFEIRQGMDKYGLFFHDDFDTGSYPVTKIIVLKKGGTEPISHTVLAATRAFDELRKQVYRPMFIHNNALRWLIFSQISQLINACQVVVVTRPEECRIEDLAQYVDDIISG